MRMVGLSTQHTKIGFNHVSPAQQEIVLGFNEIAMVKQIYCLKKNYALQNNGLTFVYGNFRRKQLEKRTLMVTRKHIGMWECGALSLIWVWLPEVGWLSDE